MKRRSSLCIARWQDRIRSGLAAVAIVTLIAPVTAQFGNDWVTFHKSNGFLHSSAAVGVSDTQEKDYAWGDVNHDGWVDLIVARKEPFTTSGRRTNVLFMNEGGELQDRTAMYAVASDVSGDQGFLTPTNDRDIVLVDVNLDGWLDIVTATTLSEGQPKHISHPRVYMNLGEDGAGAWLGFRHEDARIPALLVGGSIGWPRFCGIGYGDVTGDGFPDLYFSDYDAGSTGGLDFNDRLLINDGTGHFVDESAARMTVGMLRSGFGMAAHIVDLNGDGVNDILKDTALDAPSYVAVAYNDPANEGYFSIFDDFHNFAPYHVNVGDLNRDGRIDVIITDDSVDRYRYNLGIDSFGRVVWGPAKTFTILHGIDVQFGGNNLAADLNGDGWQDVIISDCDVDFPNCQVGRTHIYHNPGGEPGSEIRLIEEAQAATGGGWIGAAGMISSDLTGVHDVALFDLDRDGDMDMIFGRCGGTDVWINELDPGIGQQYCYASQNSSGEPARVQASGSASIAAQDLRLSVERCPSGVAGLFFFGDQQVQVPFGDGQRCVGGTILRAKPVLFTDAFGEATRQLDFDAGYAAAFSAGATLSFQFWFRDPAAGLSGFNLSDGVSVTFTL